MNPGVINKKPKDIDWFIDVKLIINPIKDKPKQTIIFINIINFFLWYNFPVENKT